VLRAVTFGSGPARWRVLTRPLTAWQVRIVEQSAVRWQSEPTLNIAEGCQFDRQRQHCGTD
jgi:hypothetical protein